MSHQYEHDDYTHPDVYGPGPAQGWAETETDPARIDWAGRQARAAIPFTVVNGRPVNPREKTRVRHGRNEMGFWGENLMSDALVTATLAGCPVPFLLMVERADGHGWAVPGGHIEPGENPLQAALRELREETGLDIPGAPPVRILPARYVPDPRASDEAWAVTVPVHVDLEKVDGLPAVAGGDDALRAAWLPAASYQMVTGAINLADPLNGVFAAHALLLTDFLGTETEAGR